MSFQHCQAEPNPYIHGFKFTGLDPLFLVKSQDLAASIPLDFRGLVLRKFPHPELVEGYWLKDIETNVWRKPPVMVTTAHSLSTKSLALW